jgi:hypothetical protein
MAGRCEVEQEEALVSGGGGGMEWRMQWHKVGRRRGVGQAAQGRPSGWRGREGGRHGVERAGG